MKKFCHEEQTESAQTAAPSRNRVAHGNAHYRSKRPRVTFERRLECTFKHYLSKDLEVAVARSVAERQCEVRFSVTKCHTYGVKLKPGDRMVLWVNTDCKSTDGRYLLASRSQLTNCSNLAADEMRSYLTGLIEFDRDSPTDLPNDPLQRISKCPGPWEFVINQEKLDADIILGVIKVANVVDLISKARKQRECFSEFFQSISDRPVLIFTMLGAVRGALEKLQQQKLTTSSICIVQPTTVVDSISNQLVDASVSLCLAVKRWCPHLISSLLPLIKLHIDFDSAFCGKQLLLEGRAQRSNHQALNSHWSHLPPIPTTEEIKLSANQSSTCAQMQLPQVRKTEPYPSVDSYLNTYTILYREDRLFQLRDTLGGLLNGTTNPKELAARVLPNIRILGVQKLRKYPGLAVIMGVERYIKFRIAAPAICLLILFF